VARTLKHLCAHDYRSLMRRWRTVAKEAGLIVRPYAAAGGHTHYCLTSGRRKPGVPSLYFSTGIHGDEAGATEGLLLWASKNTGILGESKVLIFPCLNPWGLVNNSRRDVEARDLNRCYHNPSLPQIGAQLDLIRDRDFDLALTLHEDYDAQGVYIYEIQTITPYWGEALMRAAARHIGPDLRPNIEGRAAKEGVVRRGITPDLMPEWPEAFVLHFHNVARVFTIETPSEFHLDDRVEAHAAMIEKAVELCRQEVAARK